MDPEIRQVETAGEIDTVARLARIIWNEHYVPIIGQAQVDYMTIRFQSEEAITGQISREGYTYYLIHAAGQPVGYLASTEKKDELFLSKLYVLASERGKGYGRLGVDFLAGICRDKGLKMITLTVNKYNTNTIRAYEKLGFERYGEVVNDIGEGYVMDDYLMRRRV